MPTPHTTSTVGIIGSGRIGATLARLAVDRGLCVVLSNSRGPHTLEALVADLGSRARAATPAEAAEHGDLVVASVPIRARTSLPVPALAGKIVVDTMNYDPRLHGQIEELDDAPLTTSELLQELRRLHAW